MKAFILKWGRYLAVLFSPDVVLSLIGAAVFGYWAVVATDDTARTVGSVVMAALSGLAGARLSKMIIEEARAGQIFTRGQSAVRGLALILSNLGTLEAQLEKARAECKDHQTGKDFQYIKSLVVVVQRQAVNSMEEWKDILPEADVLKTIEELRKKVADADELREALESVQDRLEAAQSDASSKGDQVGTLKREKAQLERKLRDKELEAISILPSSLSSGSLISSSGIFGDHSSPSLSAPSGLLFGEDGSIKIRRDE